MDRVCPQYGQHYPDRTEKQCLPAGDFSLPSVAKAWRGPEKTADQRRMGSSLLLRVKTGREESMFLTPGLLESSKRPQCPHPLTEVMRIEHLWNGHMELGMSWPSR